MGSVVASGLMEMAEMSTDFEQARENAIRSHFASNMYPPVSVVYVRPALDAVEAAEAGDWDEEIDLPDGRTVTATEAVRLMRLSAFIRSEEDDFDLEDIDLDLDDEDDTDAY